MSPPKFWKKSERTIFEICLYGAGEKTASLGLFIGLRIPLPDPKALPEPKDEWILILGGAGSVGQYAIQVRQKPPKKKPCAPHMNKKKADF